MKRMHSAMSGGKGEIGANEFAAFVRKPPPNIPEDDMRRIRSTAKDCIAAIDDGIDAAFHGGFADDDAAGATVAHLCRRFRAWYTDDEILRLCIGGLMRIVSSDFSASSESSLPKFTFHSGHDVTVAPCIAVLKSGGWDPSNGDVWPGYASAVVLELLEASDGEKYVRGSSFQGFHLGSASGDVSISPFKMDGEVDVGGGERAVPLDAFLERAKRIL